jgi:hypothetical protein
VWRKLQKETGFLTGTLFLTNLILMRRKLDSSTPKEAQKISQDGFLFGVPLTPTPCGDR